MRITRYDKYLSLRWSEEYNCWAFMCFLAKEEFGWDISSSWEEGLPAEEAFMRAKESASWERVETPGEGVFVILDAGRWEQGYGHIGLMIDEEDFIHNREKVGVVIEPLRRWLKRSKVKGYYRYRD